jgi:hypothetical protein
LKLLHNIIVLEELHQIVKGSEDRTDIQESIVGIMVREARKYGFGLICIDQTISELPSSITANCQTRICLGVQNGEDAFALSRMLALSREQSDYLLALPHRTAVVSYPAYTRPFLMTVREVPAMEAASEEDIRRSKEALLRQLTWVPANGPGIAKESKKTEDKAALKLPYEEQDYLIKTARDPLTPATVRDIANEIPLATGNQLRQRLMAKELIEEARVNVGKGGQVLVIAPSLGGWQYLREIGVPEVSRPPGKGGMAHCYGQHLIAAGLGKKHPEGKVAIEDSSLGKAVDVSLRLPDAGGGQDVLTAYELLCKGGGKEVTNIVQDLDAGYDKVVVCSETAAALESLKKRCERELTKEELERVEFRRLGEFYREIHPRE